MSTEDQWTTRLKEVELQTRELAELVTALGRRVARLEAGARPLEEAEAWQPPDVGRKAAEGLPSLVPLVGRSLLLLGGAYLLRAITDLEAFPTTLGLALGFVYAMLLLGAADRAAARESGGTSAVFYALVSAVVAFPLVLEAVTRFELLGAAGAAVGIGVVAAAFLVVADRRRLATAAAAASIGGGVAALALMRSFNQPGPVLGALALLGLAVLWVSDRRAWQPWKWTSALMADLAFAIVPAGVHAGRLSTEPFVATILLLGLFAAYMLAFGVRIVARGRQIGVFEVVQTVLAGVVAFAGSWALVGSESMVPGLTALGLGIGAYGVAFSPGVRHDRRRSFFFFTSVGLALVAIGSIQLLKASDAALVWAALGIGCAAFSYRYERVTLSLHSTLYLLAAMVGSGLANAATAGYWMADPASWPALRGTHLGVIAALAVALAIPAARESSSWGRLALVPRAALMLFLIWGAGGALLARFAPAALGSGQDLDAGALATVRTGLFAISAVLLAWLSRKRAFTEAGWLVYPLLIVACIRVLSQDLLEGRPVTLFVSLALLGASLIFSARWLKRDEPS